MSVLLCVLATAAAAPTEAAMGEAYARLVNVTGNQQLWAERAEVSEPVAIMDRFEDGAPAGPRRRRRRGPPGPWRASSVPLPRRLGQLLARHRLRPQCRPRARRRYPRGDRRPQRRYTTPSTWAPTRRTTASVSAARATATASPPSSAPAASGSSTSIPHTRLGCADGRIDVVMLFGASDDDSPKDETTATLTHRVQGLGVEVAGRIVPKRGLRQPVRRQARAPRVDDQVRRRAQMLRRQLIELAFAKVV